MPRVMRISVVTPSLNQARFIERTVRSVLDQPYTELEYVICDGGSSDGTQQIIQPYVRQLRLICEPDAGQADAVNKGIAATSGEIIGWLNSDDIYRTGALVTVSAAFARDSDLDVIYGDAHLIDADDRVLGRYYTESWRRERLLERCFLCQPAVFFRRRVVDRFGLLDAELQYSMDYEYWLRLAHGGARFAYLPYTLAASRLHADTKTARQAVAFNEEIVQALKRYSDKIPDGWLLTYTHALLQQRPGYPFRNPLAFALSVASVSWRLSKTLNGSVSGRMALSTLRTVGAGAAKTVLGYPATPPAA